LVLLSFLPKRKKNTVPHPTAVSRLRDRKIELFFKKPLAMGGKI